MDLKQQEMLDELFSDLNVQQKNTWENPIEKDISDQKHITIEITESDFIFLKDKFRLDRDSLRLNFHICEGLFSVDIKCYGLHGINTEISRIIKRNDLNLLKQQIGLNRSIFEMPEAGLTLLKNAKLNRSRIIENINASTNTNLVKEADLTVLKDQNEKLKENSVKLTKEINEIRIKKMEFKYAQLEKENKELLKLVKDLQNELEEEKNGYDVIN
jgi:hypothetical protein